MLYNYVDIIVDPFQEGNEEENRTMSLLLLLLLCYQGFRSVSIMHGWTVNPVSRFVKNLIINWFHSETRNKLHNYMYSSMHLYHDVYTEVS